MFIVLLYKINYKKINIIVWAIPSQGLILGGGGVQQGLILGGGGDQQGLILGGGGVQGDRCIFDKLVKFMLFMAVLRSTPFFLG